MLKSLVSHDDIELFSRKRQLKGTARLVPEIDFLSGNEPVFMQISPDDREPCLAEEKTVPSVPTADLEQTTSTGRGFQNEINKGAGSVAGFLH